MKCLLGTEAELVVTESRESQWVNQGNSERC